VITTGPAGEPVKETRTFGTLTRDLLALADWLEGAGVKAVAMEATGSYWKPIYNLLEDRFELLLANAAHLEGRARSQDRRPRRGVDRRALPPRPAARELHPAPGGARAP
jgi:transposase